MWFQLVYISCQSCYHLKHVLSSCHFVASFIEIPTLSTHYSEILQRTMDSESDFGPRVGAGVQVFKGLELGAQSPKFANPGVV